METNVMIIIFFILVVLVVFLHTITPKDNFKYLNHPSYFINPYKRYISGRYNLYDDLTWYNTLGPHQKECDCDAAQYRPNQTPKPVEGIWKYPRCKKY